MARVVSIINLKGGVGKTLTTVALAEFLTAVYNKKVLLIDLDPQTNATVLLMSEKNWLEQDKKGNTLLQLFKDKLVNTSQFNIEQAIVRNASNVRGGITNLDLLPSSLGLIEIQDSLPLIPAGHFYARSPVGILKETIDTITDRYDFVLIDSPPNLGIITLNAIYISDHYLIPCIPDILSTYGIPQILNRIDNFKKETKAGITPMGIVVTMYRRQSKLHDAIIQDLKAKHAHGSYPTIFNAKIPMTVGIAESCEFSASVNTLRQKYCDAAYDSYLNLTQEFLEYAG